MRLTRDELYMQMAELVSRRSTCYRNSVGCIIVRGNRILSTGYNGPPPGEPHCVGLGCTDKGVCVRSVHAEINAINRIEDPYFSISLSVYVTVSPCEACAVQIAGLLPVKVMYRHPYRLTRGIDLLVGRGINVYRMTSGGYIFNENTKQLVSEA